MAYRHKQAIVISGLAIVLMFGGLHQAAGAQIDRDECKVEGFLKINGLADIIVPHQQRKLGEFGNEIKCVAYYQPAQCFNRGQGRVQNYSVLRAASVERSEAISLIFNKILKQLEFVPREWEYTLVTGTLSNRYKDYQNPPTDSFSEIRTFCSMASSSDAEFSNYVEKNIPKGLSILNDRKRQIEEKNRKRKEDSDRHEESMKQREVDSCNKVWQYYGNCATGRARQDRRGGRLDCFFDRSSIDNHVKRCRAVGVELLPYDR